MGVNFARVSISVESSIYLPAMVHWIDRFSLFPSGIYSIYDLADVSTNPNARICVRLTNDVIFLLATQSHSFFFSVRCRKDTFSSWNLGKLMETFLYSNLTYSNTESYDFSNLFLSQNIEKRLKRKVI